ncbi:MAG: hypothetical protein NTZ97_03190 [Candidatus Moranbacteria bacterium]|nr:hypothetical protein [Candidatus Moranbacteria bacterium]
MHKKINPQTLKTAVENFVNSDSPSATAGKFLLMAVALGGIVFAGAIVPGLLYLMKELDKSKKYSDQQIKNAFYNLKKRKLIEIIEESGDKFKVKLTNKGQDRIKEISFESLAIKKPNNWDKKWRVLVFDIPTKPKIYNQAREALRAKIKDLGFFQMQKSVWVYPYECEDEILFIAEVFQVQKYIEILTVEKLLYENRLKKEFSL